MKKWMILGALVLCLAVGLRSDVTSQTNFLATAVTATGSATITNGTAFDSREISIGATSHPIVGIMATFTRVTGTASTLDFNFEVSYDGGTTWASYDDAKIEIATNHAAITGNVVRYFTMMALYGASHVRLLSITNNWATNCTAVNVSLSTSRAR